MPLHKPWTAYDAEAARRIPGSLGVYQIADAAGSVLLTGYAGGRSRFGLRGEIAAAFTSADLAGARLFRYEVNQMYLTRWKELQRGQ